MRCYSLFHPITATRLLILGPAPIIVSKRTNMALRTEAVFNYLGLAATHLFIRSKHFEDTSD